MDTIRFYSRKQPCFWLSNFHLHPMEIDSRTWKSVEHFYQASKTLHPAEQENIRSAPTPKEAKKRARLVGTLRSDWEDIKEEIMLTALRVKFSHPDLRRMLLGTGGAKLEEDSPTDTYWGGRGQNRLGELLMRVRGELGDRTGEMSKKVAIVGSREYPDLERVKRFVRKLAEADPGATIVSGGARGVDKTAEDEGKKLGLVVDSLKADWNGPLRKGAGYARNSTIVERCDVLAAFWDGASPGTLDTIGKAEKAGRKVAVYDAAGSRVNGGMKGVNLRLLDENCVRGCTKCSLAQGRTNTVFGQGNPDARLVFVGEAPGQEEDERGLAFVGRAGRKLTGLITGMGLSRKDVFTCNTVKCRPPGNRNPSPEETAACDPYLHKQLGIIRPEVVVALGACAARAMLRTEDGIGRLRGRFHEFRTRNPAVRRESNLTIPLMPTYHPAYLLRSPGETAKVEADLRMVADKLGL